MLLMSECRGETRDRTPGTFGSTRRLFRPVGALDVSFARLTQGAAPRRLGACPGLSYHAPVGAEGNEPVSGPNDDTDAALVRWNGDNQPHHK
jgi:hypothetical protein